MDRVELIKRAFYAHTAATDKGLTREQAAEAVVDDLLIRVREAIHDEIMRAELPREIWDTQRVKGWFVEGAKWAAGIAQGAER